MHTFFFNLKKKLIVARNNKKKKEYKTLLSVLANGSTEKSRDLLKRHSGQDAQDTQDLEVKLARVYALSTSKKDIEKEFAEIHPHKDFILKYVQPIETLQPLKPETTETSNKNNEDVKSVMVHDGYASANGMGMAFRRGNHAPCGRPDCPFCSRYFSNCAGDQNCSCSNTSNACGCSQASGYSNASGGSIEPKNNNTLMVVGMVSVVAVFAMLIYSKSSNK